MKVMLKTLNPNCVGSDRYSGLGSLPDIYCEDAVTLKPLSCFVDVNAPGYQPNPNFRIGASKAAVTSYSLFLADITSPNEEV